MIFLYLFIKMYMYTDGVLMYIRIFLGLCFITAVTAVVMWLAADFPISLF